MAKKYLILLLGSLLATTPSFSASIKECLCGGCGPFDGGYVGVSGGVAGHGVKQHVESEVTNVESEVASNGMDFSCFSGRDSHTDYCGYGEIFGGWGRQCSCLYLGGRLGVNFTNSDRKKTFIDEQEMNFNTIGTELRTTEVTFDFKPGLVFCQKAMIFGTLGAAFNCQELKGKSEAIIVDGGNGFDFKEDKSGAGFRIGGGIEYLFCRCISLQAGYVYSDYWRLRANREEEFLVDEIEFLHTIQFSNNICRHTFSLGLAYYF
ncbi:MAG: hypothetical protein K940chlam9_00415 [Chlamydiae bacterium]|nr:hypothetical protein [Chlamydiota bacterium]